jgi:ABC-type cobalamin transport system ATPase subunit
MRPVKLADEELLFHSSGQVAKSRGLNLIGPTTAGYAYVLDGIATANGEVGISGSRSSPCENKTFLQSKQGGSIATSRFHPVHVENNFNFY